MQLGISHVFILKGLPVHIKKLRMVSLNVDRKLQLELKEVFYIADIFYPSKFRKGSL